MESDIGRLGGGGGGGGGGGVYELLVRSLLIAPTWVTVYQNLTKPVLI